MDDNNRFLNSYKKKTGLQNEDPNLEAPPEQAESLSFRYEEKSGFVKPKGRDGAGMPPGRGGQRLLVPVIVGAVAVVAIIIGLVWFFNRGVAVIDFTNWTENDAKLWASDNSVNLQVEEQYNDQVDQGKIIRQSVAKGATVSKGGFIRITVSLGHDLTVELPLPDLMSMTKDEIDAWAKENFMTKVRVTTEYSEDVEAGKVISYQVNDNTVVDKVNRNTPIYVVVSKGKEDTAAVLITVPNFKEKTISECYTFASDNGIVLKVTEQYDDYAPKGTILAQSVKADEKVKKGDEIDLTVSKGKKVVVPDFSAYSKQKASAIAAELNMPVAVVEKYSTQPTGGFISQSSPAGSVYEDGDVVELDYSLGNKIVISSFVGQTEDAIETWAKGLNDQGAAIAIAATYTQSDAPKGRILYQNKSDTSIGIKTTVKITVSLGKAVFIPDFVAPAGSGYDAAITREQALAMCEALNIIPVFVESKKSGRLPGEIWYQSVSAGTEVTEGTTITLKYSPANVKLDVPDFTGKTEAQIVAAGYLKKLDITFVTAAAPVDGFANKVYQQSLRAGSTVVYGSAITLTVSPEPAAEPTVSP